MDKLLQQIASQYTESRDFSYTRKLRQVQQLRLMNNLRRGDENISSTMLFTFFNRVLSNMYEGKMQVKFVPTEEMDYKKVEMLNKLAQNDFREMDMKTHEYDWLWDTFFFGRGYIETLHFDKKRKLMLPKVLNPLAFGSDPYFTEVQDWRYYWKWILLPGHKLKHLIDIGVVDGVKSLREVPSGFDGDLWNFRVQRDQAKFLTSTSEDSLAQNPDQSIYQILEIYTTDDEGNKMVAWVDKAFGRVLMSERLDLRDDEDNKGSKWPIVVKEAFREPHSTVSFSIPDLIEDKHRAKSVLLNLAYVAAKDEANPIYQYVPGKVKDLSQLFQRQINQHIPVDEIDAVRPLNTASSMSPSLLQFISVLTGEATDPIGSGMAMSPLKKGKQTATEAALNQQLNDLAQSLQSKVMQQGEAEFWSHWYQRYLRYSRKGDEKVITLTSVKGIDFENIQLNEIKTKYPPKIDVQSVKDAEYKELVEKRDMMSFYPVLTQAIDPSGKKNLDKFVVLPKFVKDSSVIDLIIPKTIDEIQADKNNELINMNIMPELQPTWDFETHLYVLQGAKNTPAKLAFEFALEKALAMKKEMDKQEQAQQGQSPGQDQGQVKVPSKKKEPQQAAVPLTQEVKPNISKK